MSDGATKAIVLSLALLVLLAACRDARDPQEAPLRSKPDEARVALFKAAADGDIKTLKDLLAREFAVDQSDEQGRTLLHVAAQGQNAEAVELLLAEGADVNALDSQGGSPLDLALEWTCGTGVASALYAHGGRTARIEMNVRRATACRDLALLKELLEGGADASLHPAGGSSALHIAVSAGMMDFVEMLIQYGASVNDRSGYLRTPLHEAAADGLVDMVKVLLSNGAIPDAKDTHETTPLHNAAGQGHRYVAEALLSAGSDINVRNRNGCTPLLYAVQLKDDQMTRFLLQRGADCNIPTIDNKTPLDVAKTEIVKELLRSYGAKTGEELKGGKDE